MRKFYAAQSPRGFANEVNVHVFSSRRDRDAWTVWHADDGDVNSATRGARAITSREARSIMRQGDPATENYSTMREHF